MADDTSSKATAATVAIPYEPVHAPTHGPRWHEFPIRTQLPQVPWLWAGLMQASWFVGLYIESCSTNAMGYTLRKFIDDPVLIMLVASLNTAYNMLIGATCNYLSDRTWTRIGRRKPFLIFSMAASALCLTLVPFIGSFWLLVLLLVLYEAARDTGSPQEALINEVVPPQQRGRSGVIRIYLQQGAQFLFFYVMLARVEAEYHILDGLKVTGEALLYWLGALLALGMGLFYLFAVREQRPSDLTPVTADTSSPPVRLARFLVRFARDAYGDRQLRIVYLLMFAAQGTWIGMGIFGQYLYTDQWGYDMATFSKVMAYGTPAVLIAAPVGGFLVDRINRLKLFTYGLMVLIAQNIGFYIYCRYYAPNGVPSVSFLVIYPLCFVLIQQTAMLAAITTVFDYIPSSRLGTFGSGWGVLAAITGLLISNGLAQWVKRTSEWFPLEGVKHNYLSGYLYIIGMQILFLGCAMYFAREEKKGHMIKYGVLEREAAKERAAA